MKVIPPVNHRLLEEGETVEPNDLFYSRNCGTWHIVKHDAGKVVGPPNTSSIYAREMTQAERWKEINQILNSAGIETENLESRKAEPDWGTW